MSNSLIPNEKKIQLFHSTGTGDNFDNLLSFLKYGVDPKLAQGYGQGAGFYVWTTLELAVRHIEHIKEDISGYPLIVVLREHINSQNWDLDYECNSDLIIKFLCEHWDLFLQIPENAVMFRDKSLIPADSKIIRPGESIQFRFGNLRKTVAHTTDGVSIGGAQILGTVFNYLQQHFHDETLFFEKKVFDHVKKKGMAIKYVGSNNLSIHKFYVNVNGKWLGGHASKKFVKSKGIHI